MHILSRASHAAPTIAPRENGLPMCARCGIFMQGTRYVQSIMDESVVTRCEYECLQCGNFAVLHDL
jgi:hypothetical protein